MKTKAELLEIITHLRTKLETAQAESGVQFRRLIEAEIVKKQDKAIGNLELIRDGQMKIIQDQNKIIAELNGLVREKQHELACQKAVLENLLTTFMAAIGMDVTAKGERE